MRGANTDLRNLVSTACTYVCTCSGYMNTVRCAQRARSTMQRALGFASSSGAALRIIVRSPIKHSTSLPTAIFVTARSAAARMQATSADAVKPAEKPRAGEALLRSKGWQPSDRVVLFDGVCLFCNRGVDFLLKWDTARQFKVCIV
jgi:hypothetical protein